MTTENGDEVSSEAEPPPATTQVKPIMTKLEGMCHTMTLAPAMFVSATSPHLTTSTTTHKSPIYTVHSGMYAKNGHTCHQQLLHRKGNHQCVCALYLSFAHLLLLGVGRRCGNSSPHQSASPLGTEGEELEVSDLMKGTGSGSVWLNTLYMQKFSW